MDIDNGLYVKIRAEINVDSLFATCPHCMCLSLGYRMLRVVILARCGEDSNVAGTTNRSQQTIRDVRVEARGMCTTLEYNVQSRGIPHVSMACQSMSVCARRWNVIWHREEDNDV